MSVATIESRQFHDVVRCPSICHCFFREYARSAFFPLREIKVIYKDKRKTSRGPIQDAMENYRNISH
jgi:hypothetical protein